MNWHYLKSLSKYFRAVEAGSKTFEIRKNDRHFKVGDKIVLWEHKSENKKLMATGRFLIRKISHITAFPDGLRPGYVVLGLRYTPQIL